MIIHITPDEFEEEYRTPWKQSLIKNVSLDYATNAIHGWFGEKDIILFKFKDYGFMNDNRFSTRNISSGCAGITLLITKTRDEN